MLDKKDKLIIIDGNSIFYRSFYALPLLTNSEGEFSNAIYGFAIQIINIIHDFSPKYIVVAFDAAKKSFRNDIYSDYKATRKPMPEELRSQLLPLKKMLEMMNIKFVEKAGLEGDDIIGVISKRFKDTQNIIVTGDRDSFQLVDENVSVYFTKKGTSQLKIMDLKTLSEEYHVTPSLFIDLKALQGDKSDNIPGVAGVGEKTAVSLIEQFGDLDSIYNNIDGISSKSLREKLVGGKEQAYLSKKLATIVTEDSFPLEIEECRYEYPFSAEVYKFFTHYEFKSLIKNKENFNLTEDNAVNAASEVSKTVIRDNSVVAEQLKYFAGLKKIAFYFHENHAYVSDGKSETVFDFSFNLIESGVNEENFYYSFGEIFKSDDILKIVFDSKKLMYKLKEFGLTLNNYFDCSIAKYLVDGVPVEQIQDLTGENSDTFAFDLYRAEAVLKEKIENENLHYLYYEVELPLSSVLFSMEQSGFKIDKNILFSLKEKYTMEAKALENRIYELAGETFNINSPKQLSVILYEKLNLPHSKKESTSADKLQELIGMHDIVIEILRYRKVSKFLSTYIDGFLPHLDESDFVHTYFKQTLTTTGRLSSVEPNLQNIPIRSEESREIRSMFVASSDDNVLVDADYSQIELRLLAHLSGDEKFIEAFKEGADIHTQTASEVFGCAPELITPEMRRTAKVVNFGIIYGISDFGLAEDLSISKKQASNFISSFYQSHPKVGEFMDRQIALARETGKATSMFGRIRKVAEINASNYLVRTRTERASQNMPLQGTAADIIKIAMVNTFNELKRLNLKAKLIMQVHDELIIDAPQSERETVENVIRTQMENAVKLSVPLTVDVKSSYRWSDGH